MAHNDSANKAPILWIIVPVAALLTLLFVSVNHHTVAPLERLDGKRPVAEQKHHAAPSAFHSDTLHTTLPADTAHMEAPATEMHNAPAEAPAAHH